MQVSIRTRNNENTYATVETDFVPIAGDRIYVPPLPDEAARPPKPVTVIRREFHVLSKGLVEKTLYAVVFTTPET